MYPSDTRFRTSAITSSDIVAPLGFVFGPRALRRFTECDLALPVASGVGTQRMEARRFIDGAGIARFLVGEWNASFDRAGVPTRLRVAATAALDDDESLPAGVNADRLLDDLFDGRTGGLPIECWAARAGVAAVLLLLDWGRDRAALERGEWCGRTPWAARDDGAHGVVFAPVALADLHCALTTHTAAHEFGHIVGCAHEDVFNVLAPAARAFVGRGARFGVMAGARADEGGRRLEWSRPNADGGAWDFGDGDHDEAAWLRSVLPRLAGQRFRCAGMCERACARTCAVPA